MSASDDTTSAGGHALQAALPYIFNEMDEAVVVADASRRIVLVNPATVALFGHSEDELVGERTSLLYASSEDFEEKGARHYNAQAAADHSTYLTDYRRKDGSVFPGETIGGPIRDPQTGELAFLGIIRDVSARVSAERALARLHSITSDRGLDFDTRLRRILELGCEHFGLPIGILSRIVADRYEVVDAVHPEDAIPPGASFSLGTTYCCHTLAADGPVGFHHAGESAIRDHPCYRQFGLEAYLGSPILVDGALYGTLNFSSPVPTRPFSSQDLELVRLFAQWAGHELARQADLVALHAARRSLERAATTDELTGLANRRALAQQLGSELERVRRYGGSLAVAMVDFDHFKEVNDRHGHETGDRALRLFADLARQNLRSMDLAGRWGGEEFLVLLPGITLAGAVTLAERLRTAVSGASLACDGRPVPLSVSIGVAATEGDDDAGALVRRADGALYAAKSGGRDRVRADVPTGVRAAAS